MDLSFFRTRLYAEFAKNSSVDFTAEYSYLYANKSIDRYKQAAAAVEFTEGERFLLDVLFDIKKDLKLLRQDLKLGIKLIDLEHKVHIESINFTHFCINEELLEENTEYYARITLNDTLIGLFFTALDAKTAKISKMRRDDEALLASFVVDTQRANIHEQRSLDAK